jgi:hypothetical protein
VIRRLVAALALFAIGISMPVAPAPAHAARWADGPCTDNVGITVVIDFQELGGGVNVRCVPGPVASGLDALDKAGIAWEGTRRFPGFVCRIAGLPGVDDEPCGNTPPATAYWSYWIASRGGSWCYSSLGAGSRTPPPGTIEGWSFSLGRVAVDTPPPRFDPPAPIAGEPPVPVKQADCSTPANSAPNPTTPQPVATTAAPQAPAPSVAAVPDAAPTTVPAADPAQVASNTPTAAATTAPPATIAGAAPSTTLPGSSTTTSVRASTTTPPSTTPTGTLVTDGLATDASDASDVSTPLIVPAGVLGTVDLGDDGRGGGGFSAATALGLLIIAAVGGSGVWAARRRRATP